MVQGQDQAIGALLTLDGADPGEIVRSPMRADDVVTAFGSGALLGFNIGERGMIRLRFTAGGKEEEQRCSSGPDRSSTA